MGFFCERKTPLKRILGKRVNKGDEGYRGSDRKYFVFTLDL